MEIPKDETIKKPTVKPGKIYKQISAVMADVGAIGKNRDNTQQRYKFRGIDDVYNELQKVLARHKVFTVPKVLKHEREERESKAGGTLIYMIITMEYTVYAVDGSSITSIILGEAMDAGGDKASNKAMSAAHKYCLLQLFCIPTEEPKDSENDSPEVKGIKKGKVSRTATGSGKTNKAMDKALANQGSSGDSNNSENLDHDFNQQVIAEKCAEAKIEYRTFKKFLKEVQGKFKPPRKFVGEVYGKLSFGAGEPEDVKVLVADLGKSIVACKEWDTGKAS